MRRLLFALGAVALAVAAASPAAAGALTVAAPNNISIPTPFPPGCGGATEGSSSGANFNYANAETEPWMAVSPTNPNDVAG